MNNWQLCPKCNGTGMFTCYGHAYTDTGEPCDLCNGHKIIGSFTGKPPIGLPYTIETSSTNKPLKK